MQVILIVLLATLFYYFKSIVSEMLTWQNLDLKIIKKWLGFKKIY